MNPALRPVLVLLCCLVLTSCKSSQHGRRAIPATSQQAAATPSVKNLDFLEQYATTFRFRAGSPTAITPTPDGSAILFLRSGPRSRVQDLYEFDVATGHERVLFTAEQILGGGEENLTPEELARRERMRQISRGISSFELSDDGAKLLFPLSGRLFVVDRASRKVTELKSDAGYPIDPRFSPDGSKVACVREGDLYVIDLASGKETRLTTKPNDTTTNGLAEFVAQEEMDRFQGYWWSPDSTRIAYEQADTAGLETFTIADPVNPDKPAQTWPYPRPGKKNARVKLGVIALADAAGDTSGAKTTWLPWSEKEYEYLADVVWSKNAPLTIVLLNREQTRLGIYTASDAGALSQILLEEDPAWINLHGGVPAWLEDGSAFLWLSDRSGRLQLQLHARDGRGSTVLYGKSGPTLFGLAHFDRASGVAHLTLADDPAQTHIARLNVKDALAQSRGTPGTISPPHQISSGIGVNGFSANRKLSSYVVSTSDLVGTRAWKVFRSDGSPAGELKAAGEAPSITTSIELDTVGERNFRAAIIRPRDFNPRLKYPTILSVYAGPHVTVVHANSWAHLLNQWFADQGFIVVMLDGRGTPRRGRDWERAVKGDLINIALADQRAGLHALAMKHPEIDLSRVGVYGWSFGGYFSAIAAMQSPGAGFRAAVAGAPVCDWRDYDTCYTERYLGVPSLDAPTTLGDNSNRLAPADLAYATSNVLTYTRGLEVPLMIVHGTADDNVYFMHSLKMADALFKNGKDYDFLVLPGFTHMVPDPVVTRSLYSRIAAYFLQHLGTPTE